MPNDSVRFGVPHDTGSQVVRIEFNLLTERPEWFSPVTALLRRVGELEERVEKLEQRHREDDEALRDAARASGVL